MNFKYHVALNLSAKNCLVVGGGRVAERKIKRLLDAGANVNVVSLAMSDGVRALLPFCAKHRLGSFLHSDLDNVFLVIAATDHSELNREIADLCHEKNILVNVADAPELSSFLVNSTIHDEDLTISFSTGGKSPSFSKQFKEHSLRLFNKEYGLALKIFEYARILVMENISDINDRQAILRSMKLEDILDDLEAFGYEETLKKVDMWLSYYLD